MIHQKNIIVNKTSRYFALGELTKNTKIIWFLFHGYGQLSEEFIKDFTILENDSTYIVAPEALNKFYLRGFTGKVGAAWMTKEDRENEILDYTQMINSIFESIKKNVDFNNITINVLGFSQGTHTAVRWLDKYRHSVNNLVLWGGSFPRDCNYKNSYWSSIRSQIVVGNSDKFISEDMLEKEIMYFKSQNIRYKVFKFDGKHELDKKTLLTLSNI